MTSTTDADQKLWADYGTKLMTQVMGSSKLGDGDRFYLAPLSATGIAAGKNISEYIKNQGVYQAADTLLDLNTPVFMPTRNSYFRRAQLYCNSVQLFSDNNPGAIVRYNNAQDAALKAQDAFLKARGVALKAWKEDKTSGAIDPTMSFALYTSTYYPNLAQLEQTASGASGAAIQEAAAVSGPNAAQVSQYLNALNLANGTSDTPGYTMQCSPASANQIASQQTDNNPSTYISPRYDISSSYSGSVDGWIATYAQKVRDNKLITIGFSAKTSESSNFTQLGFEEAQGSVSGSYAIFFSATFTVDQKTQTKNISAAEAGSDLEVELTATDIGTFSVTPGQKWNPATLFGMPIVDNADPQLRQPVAYVDQVVLGYGVGLNIKMSSSLQTQIHNYLEKSMTTGGSASFFGFDIGLGASGSYTSSSTVSFDDVKNASSGQTISLPRQDNAYPTLLAVIGKQLPTPPPAKN